MSMSKDPTFDQISPLNSNFFHHSFAVSNISKEENHISLNALMVDSFDSQTLKLTALLIFCYCMFHDQNMQERERKKVYPLGHVK